MFLPHEVVVQGLASNNKIVTSTYQMPITSSQRRGRKLRYRLLILIVRVLFVFVLPICAV